MQAGAAHDHRLVEPYVFLGYLACLSEGTSPSPHVYLYVCIHLYIVGPDSQWAATSLQMPVTGDS